MDVGNLNPVGQNRESLVPPQTGQVGREVGLGIVGHRLHHVGAANDPGQSAAFNRPVAR